MVAGGANPRERAPLILIGAPEGRGRPADQLPLPRWAGAPGYGPESLPDFSGNQGVPVPPGGVRLASEGM
jgi:hypothetical protein